MAVKTQIKENIAFFRESLDRLDFARGRKLFYWADMFWCAVRHGCTPKNYIWFDFWRFNECERAKFMTDFRVNRFYKKSNSGDLSVLDDKKKFNTLFAEFVARPWRDVNELTSEEFAAFIKECGSVIVKPYDKSWGEGVEKLTEADIGSAENIRALYEAHRNCLVEGFIIQHPDIAALNPSCVDSIRVITYVCGDGKPRIVTAALRIGAANSVVDNVSLGGYCCEIDVKSGIVCTSAVNRAQDRFLESPITGAQIIGLKIPNWEKLKRAVLAAAAKYKNIRFVGWDIAVTEQGVDFIEGNSCTNLGVLQMAAKVGRRNIEAAAMLNEE